MLYVFVLIAAAGCALAPLLPVSGGYSVVRPLVVALAAVVGAIALAQSVESRRAALIALMPLLAPVAAVCAVAMFMIQPSAPYMVPVASFVLTLLVWVLTAVLACGFPTAARCNEGSHGELQSRLTQLKAGLHEAEGIIQRETDAVRKTAWESAYHQASEQVAEIEKELATDDRVVWVLATGYINAWKRTHRAEEALVEVLPLDTVVSGALYDELRVSGSQLTNRDEVLAKLRRAIVELKEQSKHLMKLSADESAELKRPEVGEGMARAVLRVVRQAINEYRDDTYDGFVRSRNRTWATTIVTGAIAFLLLALAIGAGASREQVSAGVSFYLVGAVVGLLARLRGEAEGTGDIADYGLSTARLWSTPLLSGLAALGGVVVVATLPYVTNEFAPMKEPGPAAQSVGPPAPPSAATTGGKAATSPPGQATTGTTVSESDDALTECRALLANQADHPTPSPAVANVTQEGGTVPKKTDMTAASGAPSDVGRLTACRDLVAKAAAAQGTPSAKPVLLVAGGTTSQAVGPEQRPRVQAPLPQLSEVFDLGRILMGLLVAAVFGLTPGLLFSRLQQQSDRQKTDIRTSEASQRSARA